MSQSTAPAFDRSTTPYATPATDELNHVAAADGEVVTPANLGRRLVARVIDTILQLGPATVLFSPLGYLIVFDQGILSIITLYSVLGVVRFLSTMVLSGYLLHSSGQTIGKRIMGLRVVGRQGQRLSLGRLVAREFVYELLFSTIVLAYAQVIMLFTGRSLHDYSTGSVVVAIDRS